ncbi:choice-of-anchor I family protein [Metabacillus sp. GX 13764]|uniref:choice-of-anchor I family protein n=1 Tax=Metabacillus kandeliae TaxID=2900151 RepID=UPI001E4D73BC|nr:choice-of-anchor I family protein [Metabacillus kandeliae]MCD7035926.1 choice-of-anchor I family protein [Metabacillus kandeliae]
MKFWTTSMAASMFAASLLIPLNHAGAESTKEYYPKTMDISKIAGYSTGASDEDGGVAEIIKYNKDNQKFYLVNGKTQTLDIVSLKKLNGSKGQSLEKEKSVDIAKAVNSASFQYGDLTSVDVNTAQKVVVAAVQEKDYSKPGKIVVMDYSGKVLKTFNAGVQPDMIKMTENGKYILTADEGEPRMGLKNGVDPEGSVTIVKFKSGKTEHVKFDKEKAIDSDVVIRNKDGGALKDLEPEYIALSEDGKKAYVTLQENNAVAEINVKSAKLKSVKSLGFKDHSLAENGLDAAKDGKIGIKPMPILGSYMPDSISEFEVNGTSYLLTANEGDATEWEEFENVADFKDVKNDIKLDSSLFKGMSKEEAEKSFEEMKKNPAYDKLEVLTDRGNDAIYTLGGRSFSIWKADTMELVYDSGSDFENITAARYPNYFNSSNDDDAMDKRSTKKGPEPEGTVVGKAGGKQYAFIGLERIGGIMAYDISNPEKPVFANYINTRSFSGKIAGDVAPEGLDFVSGENSPTKRPLLLSGNEVSGTAAVDQLAIPGYLKK